MDLHSGLPYWIIKNPLFDYFNPLKTDISTDVAIIGAGITGALMAHELCRAGLKCCVIDRRSIATGSSAASTALLQYEIDLPLCRMIEKIGEQKAVAAYRACLQSITDLEAVVRETGIEADFERVPSLFYASDPEGEELIEQEYVLRRRYELPVSLLDKSEVRRRYRIETPHGALMNKESAQIDPYKAAAGLLAYHIGKDRLQVFTHTGIEDCTATAEGCRLVTGGGPTVNCRHVVIAAGFEAGRFLPKPVMQLTSTYALISHPVPAEMLWPEHSLIWETHEPYIYVRTSGNRVIVGGEDESFDDPEQRDELLRDKTETLSRKFRQLLPEVPFETEMAWCGTFSTTPDGLPFIGNWPGQPRVFFDLGYGGNGITFSMIGAQVICRALQGMDDERSEVFGFERINP